MSPKLLICFKVLISTYFALQTILNFFVIQIGTPTDAILSVLMGYLSVVMVFMTTLYDTFKKSVLFWIVYDCCWVLSGLITTWRQYKAIEDFNFVSVLLVSFGWLGCISMAIFKRIVYKKFVLEI